MGELTERRSSSLILGLCPRCEATIPTDAPFIEYEAGSGWPEIVAECPSCLVVVHPR